MACFRSFTSILLLAGIASACTAPVQADSLPDNEPSPPSVLCYQAVPDAPDLRPPLQSLTLLATSPEHPRWAVSDERRLWVANGEGPLVEQRRDYTTRLRSVKVDHAGNVWLLDQHNRLERLSVDGELERLPPLPVQDAALVIGAKHLVLLGSLREGVEPPPLERSGEGLLDDRFVLAISEDGGHEWQLRRRPSDLSEFDELLIAPDGTMQLIDGNEASCGGGWQERWISHVDQLGWTSLDWPFDAAIDRHAGAGGWSYALDEGSFSAVGRNGTKHVLQPVADSYAFVHDGRTGVLLADDGMWSIVGRKATRIGDLAPALRAARLHGMAITHDGAVIVTAGQSIYVGSTAGWSTVELDSRN